MGTVNKGDYVRFLNSVGGGIVKDIKDNIAYVEDDDGFSTPAFLKEIVVVSQVSQNDNQVAKGGGDDKVNTNSGRNSGGAYVKENIAMTVHDVCEPFEETPQGERLTVILSFNPKDVKNLSKTTWETYLVNDSNYWMSFIYMSKASDSDMWKLRTTNIVEPSTQIFIEELEASDLNDIEHVKIQFYVYKPDKPFVEKPCRNISLRIDTVRFFKFHCYEVKEYFDEPVLEYVLVKNDKDIVSKSRENVNQMAKELSEKIKTDLKPVTSRIKKRQPKSIDLLAPLVVDLHIEELVDNLRGLSAADMLNRQVDEFRKVMDANLKNKGRKIVFIHGKGEGVLRNALLKELNYRYKEVEVQDASFREYGFGATQVTIR